MSTILPAAIPVPAAPEQLPGVSNQRAVVILDRPEQRPDDRPVRAAPPPLVEALHERVEALVVLAVRDRADGALLGAGRGVEAVLAGRRVDVGV
jgi:hypothetical protein